MKKTKPLKPDSFVVKSNDLIEARYRLSLQESHVVLWLLTQIKQEDEDFKTHKLKVEDFAKMTQVNVNNRYDDLKKTTLRLMQRVMQVYSPHEKKLIQVSWLSSAAYEDGKGYVSLRFDPALKPYLLQLKSQFTKIDVVDTLKLKSIYAVRIFELLSQYTSIGKREISVEDLRSYCGIEEKEYALYSDLKRKVINRAKTEINAKTGYNVDYKELKESRKVTSIDWIINKKTHFKKLKSEKLSLLNTELQSKNVLIEQILEYGYTRQVANRILKNHEEKDIENALKAVDIYRYRHDVKNPKAIVYSAIKEKWHPDKFVSKNSA